jgi:mRNA-degrading endonuclease YafQ of YafQ-DinJ toxin-antitoxin module
VRFYEVAARPLIARQTSRFEREFDRFAKSDAAVARRLVSFLEHKLINPTQPWDRKDTAFNNKRLKSFRHAHLVLGKVIIIYEITQGQLRLCACVEHKQVEGATKALITYLDGLTGDSFGPLRTKPQEKQLSRDQRREVIDLIYEIAASDVPILRAVLGGNADEFLDYVEITVEEDRVVILRSFGGIEGLQKEIHTVLKNIGG